MIKICKKNLAINYEFESTNRFAEFDLHFNVALHNFNEIADFLFLESIIVLQSSIYKETVKKYFSKGTDFLAHIIQA